MSRWVLTLVTLFCFQGCMTQDSTIPAGYDDGSTSDSQSLEKSEGKKKKKKNKTEESSEEETQNEEMEFPGPTADYTFAQNMLVVSSARELTGESVLALLWQLERKKSDAHKIKERPFIIVATDDGTKLIFNLARGKDQDFRDWVINFEPSLIISAGSVAFELTNKGTIKELEITEKRPECSLKVDLNAAVIYFNELLGPTHNEIVIKKSEEKYEECPQVLVID